MISEARMILIVLKCLTGMGVLELGIMLMDS